MNLSGCTHDTVVDPAGVMVDVDPDHHQRLDRDDGAPQLTAQLAVNLEGNEPIKTLKWSTL